MKRFFYFIALLVALAFTSCSNEANDLSTLSKDDMAAIENVKSELSVLNTNYQKPQTRMAKWLRWLIFGAADAAGAIWGGGVGGACTASTLAWTVTKEEPKAIESRAVQKVAPILKVDNLDGIEEGSAGYIHNTVISSAFANNEDLCSKSNNEVMNIILDEMEKQTGTIFTENQKKNIISYTNTIIDSFDSNKTVEEYYEDLKNKATDAKQKEALNICGIVLDGLQYVDDNDCSYAEAAKNIIKKSSIEPNLKATLLDGVSVANASAKLWNTDALVDETLK